MDNVGNILSDKYDFRSSLENLKDSLLIVGVEDRAPLEFINDRGLPDGYSVDICKRVLEKIGISRYKIILTSISKCNYLFYSAKADLLISGQNFRPFFYGKCSLPYLYLHNSIIIPKSSKIFSISDLTDKRLLISHHMGYFRDNLNIVDPSNAFIYKSYNEGFDSLQNGSYDAMMGFDIILRNVLSKQDNSDDYKILRMDIEKYPFSFVSSRNNRSLITHIDKALYELNLDGSIDKIRNKWFGKTEDKIMNIFLIKILKFSLFILVLSLIIMYIIRFFIKKARRDKLNESKYLLDIINNLSGFIYLIKKGDDKLFFCNDNVKSLISKNLSVEECTNSFEDSSRAREINKQIFIDKKQYVVEGKVRLNDNSIINILTYKKYVTNGVDEFILVVNTDVTDLINAREKAKKDNILQQEFLRNISHEVRTPLNAIVGFSELLFDLDTETQRKEYLNIIYTNCIVLNIIVNDILLLAKLESGTFKFLPTRVELNGMILNSIDKEKYLITKEKDVKIIFDKSYDFFKISVDQSFMYSLLHNLLSNAIKNTSKGEIRLGYFKLEDNLIFYVKDTGKGIAREKWITIFSKFSKINSFVSGTGMGLSICKEYIKYLKSSIGLYSRVNKGSLFWFSIDVKGKSLDCKKCNNFDSRYIMEILNMRKDGLWFESNGKGQLSLHSLEEENLQNHNINKHSNKKK